MIRKLKKAKDGRKSLWPKEGSLSKKKIRAHIFDELLSRWEMIPILQPTEADRLILQARILKLRTLISLHFCGIRGLDRIRLLSNPRDLPAGLQSLILRERVRLRDEELRVSNLAGADLAHTNLTYLNLMQVILLDADLTHANLSHTNLRFADLRGTNLAGANLKDANLRDANLKDANLDGANLQDANLQGAYLWGADLRRADLRGANLRGANLLGARILRSQLIQFADRFTPEQIASMRISEDVSITPAEATSIATSL